MRRVVFVLSLLCASSAAVAQNESVLILKSEQPYVSPFDKPRDGKAASQTPTERPSVPAQTRSDADAKDSDRLATERRAQEFVNRASQKAPVRKNEAVRKKEEPRPAAKREEPKTAVMKNTGTQERDDKKTNAVDAAGKTASPEPSVVPPKNTQHAKSELAPPPPPIAIKEDALTSFGKDTVSTTANTPAAASSPASSTASAVPAPSSTPASSAPALAPPVAMAPAVLVNPEEAPATVRDVPPQPAVMGSASVEPSSSLVALALKTGIFFAIGLAIMLLGWIWIKRQALHADPALKDPWFRPIKNRQ